MSGLLSAHNFADNCEQKVKILRNRLAFVFLKEKILYGGSLLFLKTVKIHIFFSLKRISGKYDDHWG